MSTLAAAPKVRFDGWRMVGLAAAAQGLALPLLGAYGIVATPLIEEFGASSAQLGLGMSLSILATALASPPLGVALDRGPLRGIMLGGVLLMFGSVCLLARGDVLWHLAPPMAFATVGMSMYGMLPTQVVLVNWFVLRRGTALSFAFAGTSLASFVIPPATAWLVEGFGWRRALVLLAGAAGLLAIPVILRLVKRPEELGQRPDGLPEPGPDLRPPRDAPDASRVASQATTSEAHGEGRPSRTANEVQEPEASNASSLLRDRNFWLIAVGAGLSLSVSISTLFLVRHLEVLGIARTDAALVPSAIALCGVAGKLGAGWLIDRVDARGVVVGALGLHALGWGIVASQSSLVAMLVAALPLGLGGGGFLPLPPVLQGRCFGRAAIGRVGGLHALIGLPFMLAAAPGVGWVEAASGGFAAPFYGLMGVLMVAAGVLALLRIPAVEPA